MKTIESFIEEPITEGQCYDNIIAVLQEAKDSGKPIDEGLFTAILGGITGVTFGPAIMKAVCKVLGINEKGPLGSLMTSRLVLGAMATEIGWRQ